MRVACTRELFGWDFDFSSSVSDAISVPSSYGFVQHDATRDEIGIPGNLIGGAGAA